jgi:hypothetical protein
LSLKNNIKTSIKQDAETTDRVYVSKGAYKQRKEINMSTVMVGFLIGFVPAVVIAGIAATAIFVLKRFA